jgi:phosphoglycerate kinase
MKSITEINNFEGKKVLVRADWNISENDTSRIESSIETISYIKNHNGIPVIASHYGREGESIEPVINLAKEKFPELREGVEFLENLRKDPREEANDPEFTEQLASKADYYVNEAFSASHRKHASIVGVPKLLPSYTGINFIREVENLSKAFNPPHPFLLILGGAKFETKLPLVNKFLNIADEIFIGGAMKAHQDMAPRNEKITFSSDPSDALDASQETIEWLKSKVNSSKFILWNGPLGKFEEGHDWGTKELMKIINESGIEAIIGGGDTESVIDEVPLINPNIYISTSGGAMLDFLANETLPGIEALS